MLVALVESVGGFPQEVQDIVIVLLDKATGGRRPIWAFQGAGLFHWQTPCTSATRVGTN